MKQVKVVIGRFAPNHLGHLSLFRTASLNTDKLIIVLGSSDRHQDTKNPFNEQVRASLIGSMLDADAQIKKTKPRCATYFVSVRDYLYGDRDVSWCNEVRTKVNQLILDEDCEVTLVGHHRDDSSFYLDMFPEWSFQEVDEGVDGLNATLIRTTMFQHQEIPNNSVTDDTKEFLLHWMTTKSFDNLRKDFSLEQKIKHQDTKLSYQQTFTTSDAVVFHKGCVLVVTRKFHPGKGCYAIPGGYLDASGDRGTIDGAIREAFEETGIKLSIETCKNHPNFPGTFDHKDRSRRGRIITHAFKWILVDDCAYEVCASDDADVVFWMPLSDVARNRHMFFEDHAEIIEIMAAT